MYLDDNKLKKLESEFVYTILYDKDIKWFKLLIYFIYVYNVYTLKFFIIIYNYIYKIYHRDIYSLI